MMPCRDARSSAPASERSLATRTTSPPRRSPNQSKCSRMACKFEPPPDASTAMRDLIALTLRQSALCGKRAEELIDRIGEARGIRNAIAPRQLSIVRRRRLDIEQNPVAAQRYRRRDVPMPTPDKHRSRGIDAILGDRSA